MQFYLDNQLIENVTNGIVLNETLDELMNKCNLSLTLNEKQNAIKPFTPFKIVDGNETLYFVVESDEVELVSKYPLMYQHKLSLIEETELLKRYQIRNSVFTQPRARKTTKTLQGKTSPSINIKPYEKIHDIELVVQVYKMYETDRTPKPAVGNIRVSLSISRDTLVNATINVKNGTDVIYTITKDFHKTETIKIPSGNYTNLSVEVIQNTQDKTTAPVEYFSTFARLNVRTYYYTLLDVIGLLNERLNEHYNFKYVLSTELLDLGKIIAPNFSFTENDFFSALNQVFAYIDGRPTLQNGEIGIKYFNEPTNKKILNEDLTGYKSTLSKEKFANGLVSKFQNAGFEESIFYPSKNDYTNPKPTIVGVPNETSWGVIVDKKIRYLERIIVQGDYAFSVTNGSTDFIISMKGIDLDLTDYTFEDTNYLQLPKIAQVNFSDLMNLTLQNNSFHYKSGSDTINYFNVSSTILGTQIYGVGFTLFRAFKNDVWDNNFTIIKNNRTPFEINDKQLRFRVEYYPYIDGKMIIEQHENKHNGEIRLSQSNGGTNLNRMGQNLYGQLLRMGNEERVATPKIKTFSERYKVGDSYENEWLVNKATTTMFKDFGVQTLQLTKNFNKMSQFIKLDQVKRFNEIDSSVVEKSEEIYKEYVYFDTKPFGTPNEEITFNLSEIIDSFTATLEGNANYNTMMNIGAFKSDGIDYWVKIPMVKYGSGNALCFEFSFESPISAGTQLVEDEKFYGEKYFSRYVLYADENGRFDNYQIQVGYWWNSMLTEKDVASFYFWELPKIGTELTFGILKWNSMLTINKQFKKQPNEIFSINYELICLSQNNNLFIGNTFIKNNALVDNCKPLKTYLYYSETPYSVMDTKVKGTMKAQVNPIYDSRFNRFLCGEYAPTEKDVAWALANENGDLLFSCNEKPLANNEIMIYLKTSKNRL